MSPESAATPILIHDRIEANRRKTEILRVIFPVAAFPAVLYVSQYLMSLFAIAGAMVVNPVGDSTTELAVHLTIAGMMAVALVAGVTILVYRTSAALVLRLTGARALDRNGEEESILSRIVENLCIGSGISPPRIAVIESAATNAYSTGLSPQDSTLVVTRGLLKVLDRRELEGVVAQELSQIGNGDVRLGTMMATVVTLLWLPYLFLRRLFRATSRAETRVGAGCLLTVLVWIGLMMGFSIVAGIVMGVEMMMDPGSDLAATPDEDPMMGLLLASTSLFVLYVFVGAPVLGLLIRRAVSREREYLADADAALLTRYPPGLARALTKLGVEGNATLSVEPSLAHLWVVDPLSRGDDRKSSFWSNHPPLAERIAILVRMGGTPPAMLEKAEAEGLRYWASLATTESSTRSEIQ